MHRNELTGQLDRILNSPEFSTKPLMGKFLIYLVTEYLEGRGDQIKGYSIGVDVFNQGENFDPDQNALVRIHAGRLRRLLKMYYLEDGINDPVYIDIPKGKYVPKFTKNNKNTGNSLSIQGKSNPTEDSTRSTIVVVPFRNFSKNDQLEYFSLGFSQELSSELTKFDDLRVVGYAMRPEANNLENGFIEQIKDRGIRFLVDGDFFLAGKQVKLSVRLKDIVDGVQLWGDNYRFELEADDLFEVEEKIVLRISGHIGAEYGLVNRKKTLDLELDSIKSLNFNEHIILLKYYNYQTQLTPESGQDLYESVLKAMDRYPDSGILNAVLANLYGNIYAHDLPGSEDAYEKFGEYAEKAFSLNSKDNLIIAILAFKCFMYDEKEKFFQISDQSLKRIPYSPIRLGGYAMFTSLYGEWEKGKELLDKIFENNLEVPLYLYGVSSLYHYQELNYEAALVEANNYQVPQSFWGPMLRAAILGQLNRMEEAEKNIAYLMEIRPDFKEKALYLISRFVKEPTLVEHVIEGLKKAGMNIT
jgi:TolB-like protein